MSENRDSASGIRDSQGQPRVHDREVIRAEQLGKTYAEGKLRTQVFDALDFAVAPGETVAILGASGAGKSTLLHLLGGLDTPTSGEVYVTGQKMSALSDAARGQLRNRALALAARQFARLVLQAMAQTHRFEQGLGA